MITQKAISEILRPLLATGVYKDERVALKDIIADFIQKKITDYSCKELRRCSQPFS